MQLPRHAAIAKTVANAAVLKVSPFHHPKADKTDEIGTRLRTLRAIIIVETNKLAALLAEERILSEKISKEYNSTNVLCFIYRGEGFHGGKEASYFNGTTSSNIHPTMMLLCDTIYKRRIDDNNNACVQEDYTRKAYPQGAPLGYDARSHARPQNSPEDVASIQAASLTSFNKRNSFDERKAALLASIGEPDRVPNPKVIALRQDARALLQTINRVEAEIKKQLEADKDTLEPIVMGHSRASENEVINAVHDYRNQQFDELQSSLAGQVGDADDISSGINHAYSVKSKQDFFNSLPRYSIVISFPDNKGNDHSLSGESFHRLASGEMTTGDSLDHGIELIRKQFSSSETNPDFIQFCKENKFASVSAKISFEFQDQNGRYGPRGSCTFDYDSIINGAQKVSGLESVEDVVEMKKLFFPMNIPGTHFLLLVANFVDQTLDVHDSLPECTNRTLKSYTDFALNYIDSLFEHFQLPAQNLSVRIVRSPRQLNSVDCGMHVIWNVWKICNEEILSALPCESIRFRVVLSECFFCNTITLLNNI